MYTFVVFLFCAAIVASSPSIQIKKVVGNSIYGNLVSSVPCRLSTFQQSNKDATKESVGLSLSYLFTINPNSDFIVHYDSQEVGMKPYLALYAECMDSTSSFLNYYIPDESILCNRVPITIGEIIQTKDSCVCVSIQYSGEGEVYVLNRISGSNVPDAKNIIEEGLYLGRHTNEVVETTICRVFENTEYTLYATVVDGGCIHIPASKEFSSSTFSDEMKWSKTSNLIWASQYAGNVNYGVEYRRYNGIGYPGSLLNELRVTEEGVLLNTREEVKEKLQEKYKKKGVTEENANAELLNNNLVWRTGEFADGTFNGLFLVFGKGNVYIYCSGESTGVEIEDVVSKGKKVGYFEDDRVDVTIRANEVVYFFFVTMVVCSAKQSVDEGIEETSLPLQGDAFYGVEVIIVSFLGEKKVRELRQQFPYRCILQVVDSFVAFFLNIIGVALIAVVNLVLSRSHPQQKEWIELISRCVSLAVLCLILPTRRILSGSVSACCTAVRCYPFFLLVPLLGFAALLVFRPSISLPLLLSSGVIAPISEELLFRGFLTNLGVSRLGTTHGVILPAVLFSLSHLLGLLKGSAIEVACRIGYSLVSGMTYGRMLVEFSSLFPSILLHILTNSVSLLLGSVNPSARFQHFMGLFVNKHSALYLNPFFTPESRKAARTRSSRAWRERRSERGGAERGFSSGIPSPHPSGA
ncbi:hypothetical protein BLSTO_02324 [Blastocystis sp. subtype 1]